MRKPDPQLIEFISRYDPRVSKLMLAVREVVLKEFPTASETVNDVQYTITNAFTFSGRFKEAFCYVVAYRTYVNLGFPQGTLLPDPDHRLKGTGKLHRHLRIDTATDLDDPIVRQFIRQAADRAEIGGGPVALKPQVVVKAAAAKKGRPRRPPTQPSWT